MDACTHPRNVESQKPTWDLLKLLKFVSPTIWKPSRWIKILLWEVVLILFVEWIEIVSIWKYTGKHWYIFLVTTARIFSFFPGISLWKFPYTQNNWHIYIVSSCKPHRSYHKCFSSLVYLRGLWISILLSIGASYLAPLLHAYHLLDWVQFSFLSFSKIHA